MYYHEQVIKNGGKIKNRHLANKIKKILSLNGYIIYEQVLISDFEVDVYNKEIELIKKYGRSDLGTGPLVNMTEGGDGNKYWLGKKLTEATKQKMSSVKLGKTYSKESRQKMSQAQTGKTRSNEHRKNISISKTGKIIPDEIRKKISETLKRRFAK